MSSDHVWIRAEAVAVGTRAILLPGEPEEGAGTIADALLRAGADQIALGHVAIDPMGVIDCHAEPPGGPPGERQPIEHAHVAVIAAIDAGHDALSVAERPRHRGAELLLAHTTGDPPPELARKAAEAAAKTAVVIEGERGGADATAALLLARLAGGSRTTGADEPPAAIRFVTLVFELEAELVELAAEFERAGIDAVLANGAEVREALAKGFADAVPADLRIPRAEVPRALGVMEDAGWRQAPAERRPRYHRKGVLVQVRPRPLRGPAPVKGSLGFAEPPGGLPAAADAPRRPEPVDPGGALRTGVPAAVTQLAAEALTVLDSVSARTREREFHGLPIQYGPGVFGFEEVTERHLDAILARIPGDGADARVVEIGTATGAVALAIAHDRPRAEVLATDVSLRALGWARRNRRRLRLPQVKLAQGSLLTPVPAEWRGTVTTVAANPPLAPPARGVELSGTSGWPAGTTTGPGADGLGLVRAIARDACAVLAPGGYLHLQLQGPQGPLLAPYLDELGYEHEISLRGAHRGTVEVAARRPA